MKEMFKWGKLFFAGVVVGFLIIPKAHAALVVDWDFDYGSSSFDGSSTDSHTIHGLLTINPNELYINPAGYNPVSGYSVYEGPIEGQLPGKPWSESFDFVEFDDPFHNVPGENDFLWQFAGLYLPPNSNQFFTFGTFVPKNGYATPGEYSGAVSLYVPDADNYVWPQPFQISVYEDASAVPEPSSLFLLGTGLLGLAGARRKKKSVLNNV